nr:transposase [Salinibacter ruber]
MRSPENTAGVSELRSVTQRLIEEVRRREKVIRIFPNMDSTWRLIGAVLAEKHEE